MESLKIISEIKYKGHKIFKVEDSFKQEFAMIDDKKDLYDSISDAKRVIRGENPRYQII